MLPFSIWKRRSATTSLGVPALNIPSTLVERFRALAERAADLHDRLKKIIQSLAYITAKVPVEIGIQLAQTLSGVFNNLTRLVEVLKNVLTTTQYNQFLRATGWDGLDTISDDHENLDADNLTALQTIASTLALAAEILLTFGLLVVQGTTMLGTALTVQIGKYFQRVDRQLDEFATWVSNQTPNDDDGGDDAGGDDADNDLVSFIKLTEHAITPSTRGNGYDLYSAYDKSIPARSYTSIYTDLNVKIGKGYSGLIISDRNAGQVDGIETAVRAVVPILDNEKNLSIVVYNHNPKDYLLYEGERIGRLIIEPDRHPQ